MSGLVKNIVDDVKNHFIESSDYNGINLISLYERYDIDENEFFKIIEDLIRSDQVSLQFGNLTDNQYIIRFGQYKQDDQIVNLRKDRFEFVCAYPSKSLLKKTVKKLEFQDQPYSLRLKLGEAQISPAFFEFDVLDTYYNDPRYSFDFEDYSGRISIKSEYYESDEFPKKDKIFLESFGLGYNDANNRAIVVYLRYLDNLTPEHQKYWATKELYSGYKILKEYYENTVIGEWTFSHSLFSAFIAEQTAVNELSLIIGKQKLFKETYEDYKRPREFTPFFLPTLKNYESFISLLDKMISENINLSYFKEDIELQKIDIKKRGGTETINKGTLRLLDEWLRKHFKLVNKEGYNLLIKAFKRVRRQRQDPAHRLNENKYDPAYFELQLDIMEDVYESMKALRIIFSQHRSAKAYKIPDWLDDGVIKRF